MVPGVGNEGAKMKDYGFQEYPSSFLTSHRIAIVEATRAVVAIIVFSAMYLLFIVMAPTAIEDLQERSAEAVALSRGVAE